MSGGLDDLKLVSWENMQTGVIMSINHCVKKHGKKIKDKK